MKGMMFRGGLRRSRGSILVSLGVHAVVVSMLATMTFYAPILVSGVRNRDVVVEQIQFVRVASPGGGGGEAAVSGPPRAERQAPVRAPAVVPTTLPPVETREIAAGGTPEGRGLGGDGQGAARGVLPARPDPRLALEPVHIGSLPLTPAQRSDSAVKAIWEFYRDHVVAAAAGRDPRDWTWERNGEKWGVDPQYIHLGKFRIPTAVLAALPIGGGVDGQRLLDGRSAEWIRNDIWEHAQRMSEDEFRSAVRRIRERVDREREERRAPQP